MTYLLVVLILAASYGALCHWLIFSRGDFQFVDNAFVAWILCNFMGRIQCITIGARCYGYAVNWQVELTPERRKHEEHHWTQQKADPYLFWPKYLVEQVRHGYDKNWYEQEARYVAGEPLR
jgi:hypothetical protein